MSKLGYTGKLFMEFVRMARDTKSYWMVPLIVVLGLAAAVIVGGQSAAPLLYTLF